MNGWIILHRKIMETSFYSDSKAVHLAVHLLLTATHKDRPVVIGQQEVTLLRGQVLGGFKRLDRELGWRKNKLRRALYKLRDAGFCNHYIKNNYSIITITNYNAYQEGGLPNDTPCNSVTPQGGTEPHSGVSIGTPIQQYNNNKNKYIVHFEPLWSAYPNKSGRKDALRHFKASVKTDEDLAGIQSALINFKNSKRVAEGYIMNGKTWFNNWQDWITNPEQSQDPAIEKMKESLK